MSKKIKMNRLTASVNHMEGDRVPISDSFWSGFISMACDKWGNSYDLYRKFDLDYIIISPNMDPVIMDFEIIHSEGKDITVKTGFGATVTRRADFPMPHYVSFAITEPEQMADFVLEPAGDIRRIFRSGQDQINCLGDCLSGPIPCWNDRVDSYVEDFPVFGGICEGYEYLWRCIGTTNALMWMMTDENEMSVFIERLGEFLVELTRIQAADKRLSGICIYGDVAYGKGMMFSPALWKKHFKPITKKIIEVCREANLITLYHGCGNAVQIYDDLIEIGLDAYHPLEVKAGLDVIKLKDQYGDKLTFVGNIDVMILESGDENLIEKEVLTKLKAALGGGYIMQSDHSVSSNVSLESYEFMLSLIKEYGNYPLDIERIENRLLLL